MKRTLEQYLQTIALIFTLLLPVSLFCGTALVEICMAVTGCAFLARTFISKDYGWLNFQWVRLMIIFWLYISVRSLFAMDWQSSFTTSIVYLRLFIFAIAVGYWLMKPKENRSKLAYVILLVSLFVCFNTLIQYFFATDLFGNTVDYQDYPRLTTPHGKLMVGMMLALTTLPVVADLFRNVTGNAKPALKLLSIMVVILLTFVVFASGERTPFFIYITGLFLILLIEKKLRKYFIPAAVLFGLLIGTVYIINPINVQRQFNHSANEIEHFSRSSYGAAYNMAWQIFKNHPVFGVGSKHFRVECQDSQAYGNRGCYLHAHNIYLEALAENGIIGFALIIAAIFVWFKDFYYNFHRIIRDPIILGAFLTVVLKLTPILSGPSIHTAWAFAPFWLMLGICYSIINPRLKS